MAEGRFSLRTFSMEFTSSLHTILEHEEPDESLELVSEVQRKHQTTSTVKRLQAPKRRTTGPTAQDSMSMSLFDPADHQVLHTILEHEESDESLELVSGVQRKHQTSSTLKRLQAPKRRTALSTAQDPMSMSPSGPADHPVKHKSKVKLPQWLVDLMFDIEEATTHELTVE